MNINKNNYEPFFIDYYDGNLSEEQVAALFLFLESNPELKAEFENFASITLDAPTLEFPDRDALKRGIITASNINQYLVASLESDLSSAEEKELKIFLEKNPQYNRDTDLYKKTISNPDYSIIYPDKKSLKQPIPFYVAYRNEIRMGIAAILLLTIIAGTVSLFNRAMIQTEKQVAGQLPAPAQVQKSTVDTVVPDSSVQPSINNETLPTQPTVAAHTTQTQQKKKQIPVQPGLKETLPKNDEPIQLANALPTGQLKSVDVPVNVETHPVQPLAQTNTPQSNEHYITVWEALRESSEKNLRKAVGKEEEVLAYADEDENSKLRLMDVVSKGVEKFSNDKAKLETTYDNDKQSKGFSFSVGKFSIEKK